MRSKAVKVNMLPESGVEHLVGKSVFRAKSQKQDSEANQQVIIKHGKSLGKSLYTIIDENSKLFNNENVLEM